jgi:hypothetical protein
MSTQVIPAAATSPSEGDKAASEEPPQPRPSSKTILRKALALANDAVLSDTANNVDGAVEAYSEAVRLLDIVLGSMENESDKAKLRDIVRAIVYLFIFTITRPSVGEEVFDLPCASP